MVQTGLFSVLIALCAWISLPTAVPVTMQTFAICFALCFLGGKQGTAALSVYLAMGAAGLPVFSHFTGGLGALLGPTGGYLFGWLLAGLVLWAGERLLGHKPWVRTLFLALGHLLCYTVGTIWYLAVSGGNSGDAGLWTVLSLCVFPFLLPDGLKLALALSLSQRLEKIQRLSK